jgi:catechol 2,3-dioxygenase-like lactoylglutathione lyase family enzyme
MTILRLEHVNIQGPEDLIRRCRDFYVDVIGLVEGHRPRFKSVGFWLYAGEVPVVHLSVRGEAPTGRGALDHFALQIDDLVALFARLEHHGVEHEIDSVPDTGITQVFVRDPAGVGVELSHHA